VTQYLTLANARIVQADRTVEGSVVVAGDRIEAVVPAGHPLPRAGWFIDLDRAFLAPGFVDIHVHGGMGIDVMDASDAELNRVSNWLANCGVTRFVPTLVAAPLAKMHEASARIAKWVARALVSPPLGAIPVGLHFEGPFLNRARCGALDANSFIDGNSRHAFFDPLWPDVLAGLPAKLITLAPEVEAGIDLVKDCVSRGLVVSLGHTEADVAVLEWAVEAGARHMTHFMNGMPQMHHRAIGPVGFGLLDKRVSVDLIADLHHRHPDAIRLIIAMKTSTKVALISDSVAPAGLGDGDYTLWGRRLRVEGLRTIGENGGLVGSCITLREAVKNTARLGFSLVDVVRMASTVPARMLGLEALGSVAPGKIADLVAFRSDLDPIVTVVAGRVVNHRGSGSLRNT
jgi:N-acetylglucosamine-6-phosphate deacetylase